MPLPKNPRAKKPITSNKRLHEQAFDNSFQANLIFNVSDGKIIEANKAACKLLGYSKKELLTRGKEDIFCISDVDYMRMLRRRKIDGGARADLSVIRKGGKMRHCEITSVLFKDGLGGSNSIMTLVDLSERIFKQGKIDLQKEKVVAGNIITAKSKSDHRHEESKEWIRSLTSASYDVIWDWDILNNQISFGKSYEKVFGYKLSKNKLSFGEWMTLFHPGENDAMSKKMHSIFKSDRSRWEDSYQFTRPDGSKCQVISRANVIRDEDGKAVRVIGVIHDRSKLQKLELILEQEIKIKERQIIEAIVEAKEMERSDLGKELHDNINQLLGASMLYLEMARKDIGNGEIYLIHCSEYTLSAIEEIRKLSKGLMTDSIKNLGLCGAIEQVSLDTMETCAVRIRYILDDSLEATMSEKFKLNVFRILQEQLNNILKHAKASHVNITLSRTGDGFILSVTDDGIGFDKADKSKGIGVGNIISRAELYKGTANFISEPGKGCMLIITFPSDYSVSDKSAPHKSASESL